MWEPETSGSRGPKTGCTSACRTRDDFRVLVDRHQQSIFRFASGMLGRPEEAQDITQETFLAAFVNLSRFDPARASFSTWLFTITRNRCINLLKRRRETASHDLESIPDVIVADPIVGEELSQQLERDILKKATAFFVKENG